MILTGNRQRREIKPLAAHQRIPWYGWWRRCDGPRHTLRNLTTLVIRTPSGALCW
jgi:hypothetical protein